MDIFEIKRLLASQGISPRKSFSQNFLIDEAALDNIVTAIPAGKGFYVEIGGGPGALTRRAIAEGFSPLSVLEIDRAMLKHLEKNFEGQAEILDQDGVKADFQSFYKDRRGVVFGNLPYQASSPILFNAIYQSRFLDSAVFLLQKEVAEKAASSAGDRLFSPLAAVINLVGSAEMLFTIPPESFYPAPKVFSSLIKINFKQHDIPAARLERFAGVMRALFAHRRKTLANVFRMNGFPLHLLENAGLKSTSRIEEIPWETIIEISNKLMEQE